MQRVHTQHAWHAHAEAQSQLNLMDVNIAPGKFLEVIIITGG